jgi:hypothetical protein
MSKTLKVAIGIVFSAALSAIPLYQTSASQVYYAHNYASALNDPQTLVCQGLGIAGIACGAPAVSTGPVGVWKPKPIRLSFDPLTPPADTTSTSSTGSPSLKSIISSAMAPKDLTGRKINIVSVPESPEIYELINGQKHAFPSLAIFYDYGYTLAMIQPITQDQLAKYPRANLVKVQGSTAVYYLTENGMLRQIYNPSKVLPYYGDTTDQIITITRKEFNIYPINQYVYQESPLNRDVFQLTATGKRYLTPMAVGRLKIQPNQIAPVSKAELDSYKTLAPLVD